MSNLERERQLARETQARLRRLEEQREQAAQQEEQRLNDVKNLRRDLIQTNAPQQPVAERSTRQKMQLDFNHFLKNIQVATGQASMDMSYLKPQSAPRPMMQPLQQLPALAGKGRSGANLYTPVDEFLSPRVQEKQAAECAPAQRLPDVQARVAADKKAPPLQQPRPKSSSEGLRVASANTDDLYSGGGPDVSAIDFQSGMGSPGKFDVELSSICSPGRLVSKGTNPFRRPDAAPQQQAGKKAPSEPRKPTAPEPQQTKEVAQKQKPRGKEPLNKSSGDGKPAVERQERDLNFNDIAPSQKENTKAARPPKAPAKQPSKQPWRDPFAQQVAELSRQEDALERNLNKIDDQLTAIHSKRPPVDISGAQLGLSPQLGISAIKQTSVYSAANVQDRSTNVFRDYEDLDGMTKEQKARLYDEQARQQREQRAQVSRAMISEAQKAARRDQLQIQDPMQRRKTAGPSQVSQKPGKENQVVNRSQVEQQPHKPGNETSAQRPPSRPASKAQKLAKSAIPVVPDEPATNEQPGHRVKNYANQALLQAVFGGSPLEATRPGVDLPGSMHPAYSPPPRPEPLPDAEPVAQDDEGEEESGDYDFGLYDRMQQADNQ